MRRARLALMPVAVLVLGGAGAAGAERECAVSLRTTPAAVRNRVLQTACDGVCRVPVALCRAVDGCAVQPSGGLRVRMDRSAAPAEALVAPDADGTCGPRHTVVLRPGERRRIRVTGVDARGRPVDRDRVVLVCRPPDAPCPTPTTTTTTRPSDGCVVTGCSHELCAAEELRSVCWWLPWYACLRTATCERAAGGQCGWRMDEALRECLARHGGGWPPS